MGDVVSLQTDFCGDLPVEHVLKGAIEADLQDVVTIGADREGRLFLASTCGDAGTILLLLENARERLMHDATMEWR